MNSKKIFLCLVLVLGLCFADSLWSENSTSAYLKKTDFKVGETLTIIIDENLNALQSGTTKANKQTNVGFDFNTQSDGSSEIQSKKTAAKADNTLRLSSTGTDRFTGSGSTQRKSQLKTTITATVIDVQPNGNIFILGQRQVKINEETEQMEISGIVRVKDISDENTILSSQVANLKIALNGVGVVANPQKPGVLARAFDWLF